jgi:hypothetical protein
MAWGKWATAGALALVLARSATFSRTHSGQNRSVSQGHVSPPKSRGYLSSEDSQSIIA